MNKKEKNRKKIKIRQKIRKNVDINVSLQAFDEKNVYDEEERYTRGIEHLIDKNLYNF